MMPVLLLLIFLVIQFAHVWIARQMTVYAAYCATRAIMAVPPEEQQEAAEKAAKVALSWICLADGPDESAKPVTIPGWGGVLGSGSIDRRVPDVKIQANGGADEVAAVTVTFRFPLMISGMAVNKIVAKASKGRLGLPSGGAPPENFLAEVSVAADGGSDGDGPWIELTETCVLPMPYSTENFPTGAFKDMNLFDDGEGGSS